MELEDLFVELYYQFGIVSLDIEYLTTEKIKDIIKRNDHDYFNFLVIMRFLKKCCIEMNAMRASDEYFDTDLYFEYQVEGLKKSHIANKIIINEELGEDEKQQMIELMDNLEDANEIVLKIETIIGASKKNKELSIIDLIGVVPNPFFLVKTSAGLEYLNRKTEEN